MEARAPMKNVDVKERSGQPIGVQDAPAPKLPAVQDAAAPASAEAAPLDEVMLAMDVVDTLRHQELVLERELEADDRDQRLLDRLREIYTSQGIEVTDEVLAQGVRALREERFVYAGPEPGFSRTLATAYVTRGRWGKWVGGTVALLAVAAVAYQVTVRGPEQRAATEVPAALQTAYQTVVSSSQDPAALDEARGYVAAGEAAVAQHDYRTARQSIGSLRVLEARLEQTYDLHIVSRPGEQSGIWRFPVNNRSTQNYYLIVEAIGANGRALRLPIRNEEDGRVKSLTKWGLRVDEETFQRVRADKADDGIIENDVIGAKRRGVLAPEYSIATTGATITDW
jgi:hypothetical protein